MLKATLTYVNHLRQPVANFELDSPATIVGRGPPEVLALPEVVKRAWKREPFQARLGDALFVGIPSDLGMARSHFCICRAVGASGEIVFVIRDLGSRCGVWVSGVQIYGPAAVVLKDGDRIECSSKFVFNIASGKKDLPDRCAEPETAADGPRD